METTNQTVLSGEDDMMTSSLRQAIIAVMFAMIMIVGLVGNILVIIIACQKPVATRSSTSIFILNLSIADLLFLLFCAPFTASVLTMNFWVFGRFICKSWSFVIQSSRLASVYTLIVLSFDRYSKIAYRTPSNRLGNRWGLITALIIWIIAAGLSIPSLVVFDIDRPANSTQYICYDSRWRDPRRQKSRYLLVMSLLGYVIPLTLLTCTYASIIKTTWRASRVGLDNCVRKSRTQVTVIISVVVLAFALSGLPHNIFTVWVAVAKENFPWTRSTFRFKVASMCIAYMNSCLNPVVYCLLSRVFRQAAKAVILECKEPPKKTRKVKRVSFRRRRSFNRLSARYKHRPLFYI